MLPMDWNRIQHYIKDCQISFVSTKTKCTDVYCDLQNVILIVILLKNQPVLNLFKIFLKYALSKEDALLLYIIGVYLLI